MAEFDLEQLKTIFDGLAARLNQTKGDQEAVRQLVNVQKAIKNLERAIQKGQTGPGDSDTIIKDFVGSWNDTQKKSMSGSKALSGAATGAAGETILGKYSKDMKGIGGMAGKLNVAKKGVDALSSTFRTATGILGNFNQHLDGSVASFGAMFGIGGSSILGKLLSAMDSNIAMYRTLQATGDSSIRSIEGMRAAAAKYGLTTEQLVNSIAQGSDGARLLGAERMGALSKRFTSATQSVARFGMSIEQTLEAQSYYAEMLRNQGLITSMNEDQMNLGLQQLIKSSNVTASILGKNRDEVLKEREEATKDATFQMSLKAMGKSESEIQKLTENLAGIKSAYGEDAARAYRDTVVTGQVQGDNAAKMAHLPEVLDLILKRGNQDRNGQVGDFLTFAKQMEDLGANMDPARMQQMAMLSAAGVDSMESMASVLMGTFKTNTDKASDGTDQTGLIREAAEFEDSMRQLRSEIMKIIDQALLPFLKEHSPKIIGAVNKLSGWISGLENPMLSLGLAMGGLIGTVALVKTAFAVFQTWLLSKFLGKGMPGIGNLFGNGVKTAAPRVLASGAGAAAGGTALAAGGLIVGGAAAGGFGLYHTAKNADESFFGQGEDEGGFLSSRASGYMAAMAGGAAIGGGIGLLGAGIGAVPGAIIGGGVGLGGAILADVLGKSKNDEKPENLVSPQNATNTQQTSSRNARDVSQTERGTTSNDTSAARPRASMESISSRIATLTETGNSHLRMISESNRSQLEIMREEMAAQREYYTRSLRLMEDQLRALKTAGTV